MTIAFNIPKIDPIDRAAYEATCIANGFAIRSDDDVANLADRYCFGAAGTAYTSLSDRDKAELHNSLARGYAILPEYRERQSRYYSCQATVQPSSHTLTSGQIWEPCPHCGQEPVLMPRMVCSDCSNGRAA